MPQQDWRPHFPLATPRPEQARALDWICEQLEAGHRHVICELGTGVGKSAIAITVGAWLEEREGGQGEFSPGVTVLTSQKVLQDQYVRDFKQARDLRAAANFKCHGPVNGTCGETSRVRKAVGMEMAQEKLRCSACPYRVAKDDFVSSEVGITNYSYHLSEAMYAGEIPARRLLVLDEAHNVEDEVRKWTSVEISEDECDELKLDYPSEGSIDPFKWLGDFRVALATKLESMGRKLKQFVSTGNLGAKAVKGLANDNDRMDKRLCQINRLLDKGGKVLVSWQEDPVKHRRSIKYQPLDVRGLVQDTLYSRASAVLLMSATLLDKDVFRASVGLEAAPFLSIPTPFKAEAFGISFRPVGKMTMANIDRTLRDYPRAIRRILQENPDAKGIIHTTNYKITRALREALSGEPRLIFQTGAGDREGMLTQHMRSKEPTVLVSPSMMEGLDLRDDLGRFQVMCKVPYPDLSDPIVKAKDRDWYNWRTIRTLVQAVGRSVRSESDWTKTYILDSCFMDLLERSYAMFPVHLKDNVRVEEAF
jgi:ATP-dependent DNA helicase DinG